jgi:hypothetical protein
MHPIFQVTSTDIQSLDDTLARELVARLCRAEMRAKGLSQAFVTWGGDQRAKDGGVDVRVDIDPPAGAGGYIPKDASAFQVKAEKFASAKILKEMAPKGKLRPAIKELAESTGAYIIVSTKDTVSDESLADRKNAMAECLSHHRLKGKIKLDFYDSRKLSDWVEHHPTIVIWLKYTLGRPIIGWQPYAPWAYHEDDIKSEYLIDKRVKIFAPNADEGIEIGTAIDQLRGDLSKNVSVRIVGLSGVGKTRLAQALFDDRVKTEQPVLDRGNVLYTDLSNNPTPQPIAMLEALWSGGTDCVVVVDNCGPDVHQKLTEIAKRSNSKLRLITIEYDIRDDLPEDTKCYRLEGSSDDVIKELLKRRYNTLSEVDLDKIAEFSAGNARVAFALASTTKTKGELAQLQDAELFKRLFVQKYEENDELLKCAEIASLLYSVDVDDTSANSELSLLASMADVSILAFSRNIEKLRQRGLVQSRGKWRAVLPHAISNHLAVLALESYPKDVLVEKLIDNASDRVARSFSRRLGFLHESARACEIVIEWLGPGGRMGDATKLNELGRQIFNNIAPIDQNSTLENLLRATESREFLSTENRDRGHFARTARSLAYEPELFENAVEILLRFALAEPEGYNYDSTREILKSLFSCHLSGTEAPAKMRANFVRRLVNSNDVEERKIGLTLLSEALKTSHFSAIHGFDFGARKRGYGWWPRTGEEYRSWYCPFIDIALEIGKTKSDFGREARVVLGDALRGLWVHAGLCNEIIVVARQLMVINEWPEGWLGVRRALHWDKTKISRKSLFALMVLENELAPSNLKENILARVLARGSFAFDLDDEDDAPEAASARHSKAGEKAETLGKQAAVELDILAELLPELLKSNSGGNVWNFGYGVGQSAFSPTELMDKARSHIKNVGVTGLSLQFIRGIVTGWHMVKPGDVSTFLDGAISDDIWGVWFPNLQVCVNLDDIAHARLMKSIELRKSPSWQFGNLGGGRVTDPLSVEQISTLVNGIAAMQDDGLTVAIDVLSMVIFCAKEKTLEYREELASHCIQFLQQIEWSKLNLNNDGLNHKIGVILEFVLVLTKTGHLVSQVLSRLVEYEYSESRSYAHRQGRLLEPFFRHHPKLALDAVYMRDSKGTYNAAQRIVSGLEIGRSETAVRSAPDDVLMEWCDISPDDRCLFAAQTCKLFEGSPSNPNEEKSQLNLSSIAKRVLIGANDKNAVLTIFVGRLYPNSWSGSLAKILRERLPLLDQFDVVSDEGLRVAIAQAKDDLTRWITAEEKREETDERDETGSFE